MTKHIAYRKIFNASATAIVVIGCLYLISSFSAAARKTGTVKISFVNTVNGKPVVLRDSMYTNYFGEQYSISKLKYYISNIAMPAGNNMGGYYLVNEASGETAFEIQVPAGTYNNIEFLLGVDSIRNCSGAQTGALDPMNDMFWTWLSGYVMFKLEGTSPASTSDLQRIEHHIGGYKGANNVATMINLDFKQPITVKTNSATEIIIEMNLDNYWHGNSDIRISELPVCMTPGALSKKIAANFKTLFSVKDIHSIP